MLQLNGFCDQHLLISSRIWEIRACMLLAQTFNDLDEQLNLTRLAAQLFHFMPFVPYKGTNTRKFTLLLVSMKFWAWSAKFCCLIFSLQDKTHSHMLFHFQASQCHSRQLGRSHGERFYVEEHVTNVFGRNLHRLRKDAYPDWFCFRPFSFCSS